MVMENMKGAPTDLSEPIGVVPCTVSDISGRARRVMEKDDAEELKPSSVCSTSSPDVCMHPRYGVTLASRRLLAADAPCLLCQPHSLVSSAAKA